MVEVEVEVVVEVGDAMPSTARTIAIAAIDPTAAKTSSPTTAAVGNPFDARRLRMFRSPPKNDFFIEPPRSS